MMNHMLSLGLIQVESFGNMKYKEAAFMFA